MPNMPKSSSRSPRNFFTDLVRSATSIVRPASTPPASAFSRSHAPLPTGSNAHPPTTLDPSLDLRRIAFHEEPYTLSPLEGPYGYFPMRLGQKLRRGTCEIVRKLGYGTNSSVWLAKETTPDGHRYIVLKIMSVYATEVEIRRLCYEGAVAHDMTALGKPDQAHPGYRHCAIIGRTFFEHSAHDLSDWSSSAFCSEDDYEANVKSANILHHPRASTEQIDRFLADNPPQMYEDTPPVNPRISPEPIPALRSQPLPNFGLDPSYANISIKLIDYDSAIRAKDIRADTPICTPTELRAPEMLLGHAWSYPVEVWAVGCLIFYLLTHETVFPTDTEDLLPFIYDYLGPFPEDFVRRCTKGRKCIDRNGIPLGAKGKDGGQGSLESRFATLCDGLSAQDIGDTCRFLRKCLAIDPLARPTVSQLLQDAWLKI